MIQMDNRTATAKRFLYCARSWCLDINACSDFILRNYKFVDNPSLAKALSDGEPEELNTEECCLRFLLAQMSKQDLPDKDCQSEEALPTRELNNIYERIIREFDHVGLSLSTYPEISFVENYPFPYEHVKGVALAPDATDRERYGLPFAILIRKGSVDPSILPIIIAHELVHFFVSNDGELARGLEEGLADFLAFFVVGPKLVQAQIIKNYFLSKRVTPLPSPQKFKTYMDYLRLALFMYNYLGLQGLVDAINAGRKKIKALELEIVGGGIWVNIDRPLPVHGADEKVLELSWSLINNFPVNEVVTPSAFVFLKYQDRADVLQRLDITSLGVLEQIEDRIFGCLLSDVGGIEFDDFGTLSQHAGLRFDVAFLG